MFVCLEIIIHILLISLLTRTTNGVWEMWYIAQIFPIMVYYVDIMRCANNVLCIKVFSSEGPPLSSVLCPLSLCVLANHYPKFLFNAVSSYLVLCKQIWISNMNIQCIHSNFIGEAGDWRCYEADKSMQVLVCKLYLHFAVPRDELCSYTPQL